MSDGRVIGARVKLTREIKDIINQVFHENTELTIVDIHPIGGICMRDDSGRFLGMSKPFDDAIVLVE